jgi:hypothetical protein
MSCIQLEFDLHFVDPQDKKFILLQKQIDTMEESMGKVRRKLFAEWQSVKKLCEELKQENECLKSMILEMKSKKNEWSYGKDGSLFCMESTS